MHQVVVVGSIGELFSTVADRLSDQGHEVRRFASAEDFLADAASSDLASVIYAMGATKIDRERISRAKQLRALISPITGTEGFDRAAANDHGVVIGSGQIPENYESMAEATVLLILASLYDLPGAQEQMRRAGPPPRPPAARMLKGKRVGLIGFGRIARATAERLAAFQPELVAYSPRMPADPPPDVEFVSLETLLRTSDVICVLANLNEETRRLLDRERLGWTKPGAVLVNTARGGIVDETALVDLARAGHFSRIALDVFEIEPLPLDHPLRDLPDAILTPHSLGHTRETIDRLPQVAQQNIERVLAGVPPLYIRNPEVLPEWTRRWGQEVQAR